MIGKRLAVGLLSFILFIESSLSVVAAGADGGVFLPSASASVMQQTAGEEQAVLMGDTAVSYEITDDATNENTGSAESLENEDTEDNENNAGNQENEEMEDKQNTDANENSTGDSGKEEADNIGDSDKEEAGNTGDSDSEEVDNAEDLEKENTDNSGNEDIDEEENTEDNDGNDTDNSISDNTTDSSNTEDSISDNTTDSSNIEDSISDNTTNSVSENTVMSIKADAEIREELEAEAQAELQRIAQEKNIYALIYLTDSYPVKTAPDKNTDTVMSLGSGHTVQIMGMAVQWRYQEEWEEYIPLVWFQVQFYENEILYTGYIEESYLACADELLLQWKEQFQELFPFEKETLSEGADYSDVEQFPASYQVYLKSLKEQYPNWIFVRMDVTYKNKNSSNYGARRSWEDCVKEQLGDYSWIYYTQPDAFKGEKISTYWYYASLEGISYYMDPRNFLTAKNIFQFELNSYNETYHTPEAVQKFLNNTFMEGVVPGDPDGYTHAQVIWKSGESRNLSPFVLAARVIQEQGTKGTSAMISGTYPGYEGYYNYYNIGASGKTDEEVLKNGLAYAKSKGWNTRTKALDEGAETLSNGYVSKGQDTLYLQKFDVEKSRGHLFQYMQNITAAYTEGRSMRSMYEESGVIDKAFVFKIPVFLNMPGYELETKNLEMEKGTTAPLKVTYSGKEITSEDLVFEVEPEGADIVSVSEDGIVTALDNGTATIQVSIQEEGNTEEIGECTVTVISPLKGIGFEKSEADLYLYDESLETIPVLNEAGETEYRTKAECPSELTLTVQYDPVDTTDDKSIKWVSNAPEIVEVAADETDSSKAKVTAKKSGTAVITATSVTGGYTASVKVNVQIPITEAKLNKNQVTLYQGQSETLTASYFPYNTTDAAEPEWYSDDPAVADVENGKIVAKGEGTTEIHAAIGPFDGSQEELSCTVTVESYKVSFLDENGENIITVLGEYGKKLSTLENEGTEIPWNPEMTDKIFLGWYTEADGNGDAVTQDSILYGDLILYPYFIDGDREFYVKPIGNLLYTGGYLKPEVEVYHKGNLLTKGKDYTVSYANNKAVGDKDDLFGQPKVIVKGKGEYNTKTVTETFSILPKDISQIDVKVSDMLASYTGKVQKMRPVVKDDNRTLQLNKDYTLEYVESEAEAYREAGTYEVKITGKGNYTGSRMAYITISKRILISQVNLGKMKEVSWKKDSECIPVLDLSYQGIPLLPNKDYKVTYKNNTEIGTATVVITGKGSYIGTREETFQIVGADFTKVNITGVIDLEYTGEAVVQSHPEVKDASGQLLEKGTDYEVTYLNNIEPGRAVAVFTGKGGFEGTVKKNFKILPYDIGKNQQTYTYVDESGQSRTDLAFQIKEIQREVVYDKAGAEPDLTVTYKGKELTEGVDYTLDYENNDHVSEESDENQPVVIITGKGNFTGSMSENFTILPKELSEVTISARDVKFRNKKGFWFIEPELRETNGRKLTKGIDYSEELIYTYGTDVVLQDGTIRFAGEAVGENDIPTAGELEDAVIIVTAVGTGNYTGTHSVGYRILKNASWSLQDYIALEQDLTELETVLIPPETRMIFEAETFLTDENSGVMNKNALEKEAEEPLEETMSSYDAYSSELKVKLQEYYLQKQGIEMKPLPNITGDWYREKLPNMLSMIRYVNIADINNL